jgi:hypothetical protein
MKKAATAAFFYGRLALSFSRTTKLQYRMHRLFFVFLFLSSGVRAQGLPDALDMARRFADAGAWQGALARVEQQQPAEVSAPRWGDWEQLRCTLMYRLNRHQEFAKRIAALPPGAPQSVARHCLMQGARAAIAVAQGASARELLARLLWQYDTSAEELRQVRLLVIEAYLAENKPREAYMLMLRYQQDYKPIDRDTAARFVEALLAGSMEQEAVNWLSQLDDAGPVKLLLRMRTNLVAPDAAIAQARAALAKNNAAVPYWLVLQHAATAQRNTLLHLEAAENLLQLAVDKPPERAAALAADLWKAYTNAALEIANQEKLLVGDETNWSDFGARRASASPTTGRAFFAHLAVSSRLAATRLSAQLQLVYSLQSSKLPLTAVRLFSDAGRFPAAQLDPQARFLLGSMAAENNLQETAARFWMGLSAPPNLDADEWNLRLAQSLVRAGAAAAAGDALRALIAGKKTLTPEMMRRAIAVVVELQDGGDYKIADELYRALLPLTALRERRDVQYGIARIAETNHDYPRAAEHFLQAALMLDASAPDTLAISARIAAGANLGRAGLKDDARAQFDWLLKNVKDPEKLETIRRELQKL